MYCLEFTIEGLPKTLNSLSHVHWRYQQLEMRKWTKLVTIATLGKTPPKPLAKAKITYKRHSSVEPDHDNMVGSYKFVQDALIKAGIIINDKPSVIGKPDYFHEYAKPGKGFITVKVEAVK